MSAQGFACHGTVLLPIGMNSPSTREPWRLKYQVMELIVDLWQPRLGVYCIYIVSMVASHRTGCMITHTGRGTQRVIELRQRISFSVAWCDALRLKPAVRRKGLEQRNSPLEECDSLSTSGAAGRKTRRLQGVVASTMSGPLVLEGHEIRKHDVYTGRTSQNFSGLSSLLIQFPSMNDSVEPAP